MPTIEEILKALEDAETLKAVKDKFFTPETLVKDPEFQPHLDRAVQSGIESFKSKGMLNILEEKKKEYYTEFAQKHGVTTDPDKKALEDRLAELEKKTLETERGALISSIKNKVLSKLAKAKLDTGLVDLIHISEDEASTLSHVDRFITGVTEEVQKNVKSRLGSRGTLPDEGEPTPTVNPFSKKTLNLTQQAQLLKEDPEKAMVLKKQAEGE